MIRNLKRKATNIKSQLKKLDIYSPYPCYFEMVMSDNEKEEFIRVSGKSKKYLEFGSGGSTIKLLKNYKTNIYSVESSLDWIQSMRRYLIVRLGEKKRLQFFNINIGKTKEWGFPVDESSKHLFPNYSQGVFNEINPKDLDVIFVDGRFRVACTLSTIINTYTSDKENNQVILIHDFWNRDYYHHVLKYLEVVNKVDTLGVFKVKKDVDISQVKKDYEEFKFDYK